MGSSGRHLIGLRRTVDFAHLNDTVDSGQRQVGQRPSLRPFRHRHQACQQRTAPAPCAPAIQPRSCLEQQAPTDPGATRANIMKITEGAFRDWHELATSESVISAHRAGKLDSWQTWTRSRTPVPSANARLIETWLRQFTPEKKACVSMRRWTGDAAIRRQPRRPAK